MINSTSGQDGHSKSDEDVLYQKGASFSAKLANDNTDDNHLSSSYSSSSALAEQRLASSAAIGTSSGSAESGEEEQEDNEDASIYLNEDLGYAIAQQQKEQLQLQQQQQEQQHQHEQKQHEEHYDEVNLQDYYISNESGGSGTARRGANSMDSADFDEEFNSKKYKKFNGQQAKKFSPQHATTTTHYPPTISSAQMEMPKAMPLNGNNPNELDGYYVRQQEDMSIYDDVNNNQLNLRSIQQLQQPTYQQQQQHKQVDREDHAQISNHNTYKANNDNSNKNHNKFKNFNNNNNYIVVTAQSTKTATATGNIAGNNSNADKISANISYIISSKATNNE